MARRPVSWRREITAGSRTAAGCSPDRPYSRSATMPLRAGIQIQFHHQGHEDHEGKKTKRITLFPNFVSFVCFVVRPRLLLLTQSAQAAQFAERHKTFLVFIFCLSGLPEPAAVPESVPSRAG